MPFFTRFAFFFVTTQLLSACSPALNWRDVRAGVGENASEVSLQLPCKPVRNERKLRLGGGANEPPVSFTLTGCSADGMSFALGAAEMSKAESVASTLDWLAQQLARNLQNSPGALDNGSAFQPKGADAQAGSKQYRIKGKLPDGSAVEERVAVFAKGARVYQATIIAPAGKLSAEAAEQFFNSIAISS